MESTPQLRKQGKEMAQMETVKDAYLLVEDDKIRGLSYEEIAKRGGGILNSAKATAAACGPRSTPTRWPSRAAC